MHHICLNASYGKWSSTGNKPNFTSDTVATADTILVLRNKPANKRVHIWAGQHIELCLQPVKTNELLLKLMTEG